MSVRDSQSTRPIADPMYLNNAMYTRRAAATEAALRSGKEALAREILAAVAGARK